MLTCVRCGIADETVTMFSEGRSLHRNDSCCLIRLKRQRDAFIKLGQEIAMKGTDCTDAQLKAASDFIADRGWPASSGRRAELSRDQLVRLVAWYGAIRFIACRDDSGGTLEAPGEPVVLSTTRHDLEPTVTAPPCFVRDGQTVHPNAFEDGPQRGGWPAGDTVRMRCPDCGETWMRELPQ